MQEASVLPSGYRQLNYIECSGVQFINTGVIPSPNLVWELDAQWVEFNDNNCFGYEAWNGSENNRNIIRINFIKKNRLLSIVYGDIPGGFTQFNLNADDTIRHVIHVENGKQSIDGVEVMHATMTKTGTNNVLFFAVGHEDGAPQYWCAKARLYYSWMKDGNALVRNFMPALRLSDNKPGLYDTVNGVFYTNAGTGEFLYN